MSACPHSAACALARSLSMREALGVWQSFYCDGAFARCERFKLVSAGRAIPERLLPNGRLQEPPEEDEPLEVAGAFRS